MIRFESDYLEGAHPRILARLAETNGAQTPAYGEDAYCEAARRLIRERCESEDAYVQFLVGGTQANATLIAAALRPHQGAVAASTGHINIHETGAIEATGHKVLPIPSFDGKIAAADVAALCRAHYADASFEHMVQPGLVYLSLPTENGTMYTKAELLAMRAVCDEFGMLLYVDGARLGYGLASAGCDLTLPDLARLTDAFYIGGTKMGALFGEAMVISNAALKKDFRYHIKQRGGMLAKGRLLGLQFETLFADGLYFELGAHATGLAMRIRRALVSLGVPLLYDSPTNQQYPVLPNAALATLQKKYSFCHWTDVDQTHTAVRICTSWTTPEAAVTELIADLTAALT